MNGTSLHVGDQIDATVTRALPFGLLVATPAGVPGLVCGASAEVGAVVRVHVDEYDAAERRFRGSVL